MVSEGDSSPERGVNKRRTLGHTGYDPIASIRDELDGMHREYSRNPVEAVKKRRVRAGYPKLSYVKTGEVETMPRRLNFFIKGLEQFQIRFKAEAFAEAEPELRLLLAVGDSNHPVNASLLGTKARKDEYIRDIINQGQRQVITSDGLHHMMNEAVEEGTVTLGEEGVAELTEAGFESIEGADAVQNSFRGQGFNFS